MSSTGINFGEARDLAQDPNGAIAYVLVLLERLCEAVEALDVVDQDQPPPDPRRPERRDGTAV